MSDYAPFDRGPLGVAERTVEAHDTARDRSFTCEHWYPEAPGTYPLVVYSHPSGSHRRAASFLCSHLASHGYIVAALDHSEVVAPELGRRDGETSEQRTKRWDAVIASRIPDVRFLFDRTLELEDWGTGAHVDPARIGIVGHSFGGWTALALPGVEPRVRAVVALAPGGASNPKPGLLPLTLAFDWKRDVPTLYLVAENDSSLPLDGMAELFGRTPSTRSMYVLRRSDHMHFVDDVEILHEAVRNMVLSAELAWLGDAMRPIEELCSGEEAHVFARGLTLCHLDSVLKESGDAQSFPVDDALASRSIDAYRVGQSHSTQSQSR